MNDGGKERTRLEVDQFKSRVVASIFDKVLKGQGLIEITKELNSRGIASPTGKGCGKTGFHKILGNEVHTGTAVWGRNSKRGLPPIRVGECLPGNCQPGRLHASPEHPGTESVWSSTSEESLKSIPVERIGSLRSLWEGPHRDGGQERKVRLLRLWDSDQERSSLVSCSLPQCQQTGESGG